MLTEKKQWCETPSAGKIQSSVLLTSEQDVILWISQIIFLWFTNPKKMNYVKIGCIHAANVHLHMLS